MSEIDTRLLAWSDLEVVMKKVLLTTSALAGASLMAAPATADAPVMTFSGALAYEIVMFGGDVAQAGTGTNITANEQQSELVWDARGSADNGLNYRANLQWRALTGNTGAFDESWIDFTGGFGRLYIGSEDGVSDLVAGTSGHSVQVGTWGTDGNNALRHVNFLGIGTALGYYASHAGMTGDANKIGYITPNFGGFSAGVSYSPNSSTAQAAGTNNDANANAFEFAAGWSGAFGDVTLGVDGSYGIADDQSGTLGTRAPEDVGAYMVGATVGFAGFQVAGAWLDNQDSNCAAAVANCDAGDGWNIGASYNFGPGAVSVMWQTSESDTDGNGRSDEADILHAGVNYRIAEGLSAHLNGYWFDLENEAGSGVATNSNDATVVILGTRITF
jgi:outer membrane protein OmpU